MLSQKTIQIVKSTAPILAQHGNEITSHFYRRMFNRNPELLNLFNHANQRQGRQQAALANTVYAAAANIDNLQAILPVVQQIAHKHRSLGVTAEQYPIVGENLLAAMAEVLGEAATPEILEAWSEAYGVIADIFISVEKDMYDDASGQSGGWEGFRSFRVARKVQESSVITSFYLVPTDGGPLSLYKAGQYVSVRLQIPGELNTHIRQYSLSDVSGKLYYRISVKRENATDANAQGIVSSYLHSNIQAGDELELSAPAGDFVLDTNSMEPIVLISGGVGLTPLVSMLHTALKTQPGRKITFIHAAIDGKHHALRNEVEQAISTASDARSFYVYEKPASQDMTNRSCHYSGYISLAWLQEMLPGPDAVFYFCGPLPFMKSIYNSLLTWGVPPNRIHYELFGPAANLDADTNAEAAAASTLQQ